MPSAPSLAIDAVMQIPTDTVFNIAVVGVAVLTLDTLRRYFTAKKRWPARVLIGQLVLLPLVAVGGLALVLLYLLPMLTSPRP